MVRLTKQRFVIKKCQTYTKRTMCLAFSFNIINRHELNHISTNINSTPGRREERTKMYGVSHYLFKSSEQPAEGCLSRAGDWPICVLALINRWQCACRAVMCIKHISVRSCQDEKSEAHSAAPGSVLSLTQNSNGALWWSDFRHREARGPERGYGKKNITNALWHFITGITVYWLPMYKVLFVRKNHWQ